jgi:hypothetical protein
LVPACEAWYLCSRGHENRLCHRLFRQSHPRSPRSRAPDLRLSQPSRVQHVLFERRALGAQRPAVRWMIRITLDVNHLWRDVLCPIANRVDEDAASDRAIGTRRACFGGACNLQLLKLRESGLEVEPKDGSADCAYRCCLEEVSGGIAVTNHAVRRLGSYVALLGPQSAARSPPRGLRFR